MPCSDETVMTEFWCDADLGFALTSQEKRCRGGAPRFCRLAVSNPVLTCAVLVPSLISGGWGILCTATSPPAVSVHT